MRYPRGSHLSTRLYPTAPQTPLLETSGHTTSETGAETHPSKKKKKKEMTKNTLQMKNHGEKLQDQINEEGIATYLKKKLK